MGIFNFFKKNKIEKKFYENGQLKNEASYKSGKKNGPERGYYENGELHYECEWKNGKQHGKITSYDENGNTIKQSLLNYGIYEGPQKEWWPNGNLRAARIMKNNEIDSEEIYAENGKHIVLYENIKDIGIVSHYNGKPFNGIMLAKHKTSLMGMRLPAHIEYEMVDGLKDGIKSEFYENGNIKIKTLYSKDEFINIIAYFDFEGNNLIETETCLEPLMLKEKNDIYFYNGKPYNGSVLHPGNSISKYTNGIKISSKHYFQDGKIQSISETIDGEFVKLKGWIKVNEEGKYDESGKRILIQEYKNGKKIEYYNSGNIKSKTDVFKRKTDSDQTGTFEEVKYFENGNLEEKVVKTKYDSDGNNGGLIVDFISYYSSGALKKEKVEDKNFNLKYISYHENKTIKAIQVSLVSNFPEHTFTFDEKGNETTIRHEEQLIKEEPIRECLNIGKFNGQLKSKPKQREILSHEIMTKGVFMFETTEGKSVNVFGQRHMLVVQTEVWNEEIEEWEEVEREEDEEFYLTDYEKGFLFYEDDLYKFFKISEETYLEWDFNGFSYNWCGIDEDDDFQTRQKKWDDYKNKFTKATSKEQFDVKP